MSKFRVFLGSALASLAISVVAGFAQANRVVIMGIKIPYGLPLALLLCIFGVLWLNRFFGTRFAGLVFLVIWVITTLQFAIESSGGDLVLSATWYSSAYVIAGAVLVSASAMAPPMRKRESETNQIQDTVAH
jgi:hypothetical protein